MNITMVSMAVGEKWEPILEYTTEQNTRWCVNHGIWMVSFPLIPPPPYPMPERRPSSWYKLMLLDRVLKNHGGIAIWIDADAIITGERRFGFPGEQTFTTAYDHNGANCGFIVLREGSWATSFIDRWWKEGKDEIDNPWWEQKTLHRMMDYDHALRRRWTSFRSEEQLIHAAGIPLEEKLSWLKERKVESDLSRRG